ncbi:23S rRNA (uracil(1939)-C(5))-methyltransferase RlmD [Mycoplasmopsis iners]|uniref:23S rRNA (uracil(1939)-C(5))-methyltransferase RlmD n=1 Tax=Mycoplasmopsis iners TaxID=76630 RepID=UPI0004961B0E|nr:23S rRNA (uracil(1939)-C(5))-methyltransferase RlmD [Mycoplasmopsis iners]
MNYQINQIIKDVECKELSYEGYGVVLLDNYKLFIENFLPGEIADVQLYKVNSKFAFGKTINLYKRSKLRIPVDDNLIQTGVAPLSILPYNEQLKFKENIVKNLFSRNLNFDKVESILASPLQWNYRNKVKILVKQNNGEYIFGAFEKNTNNFIQLNSFPLANKQIELFISEFRKFINENDYFKDTLKELTITCSTNNLFNLIINSIQPIKFNDSIKTAIIEKFGNLHSIVNISNKQIKEIFKNPKNLYFNQIDSLNFIVHPFSFFQINTEQISILYSTLANNMNLKSTDVVLDAYCGVGTIGLFIAKKVNEIIGIEIIPEATQNAKLNAKLNKINNAEFYAGDIDLVIKRQNKLFNKIIVDPPREGLTDNFINKILEYSPEEIGYISCNPHTMVRDIQKLIQKDYQIDYVKPVDMFPQTFHIECVAVLSKKKSE